MKKVLVILTIFVIAGVGALFVFTDFLNIPGKQLPLPKEAPTAPSNPVPTSTPSNSTPTPESDSDVELPANWTTMYDGALGFKASYSSEWTKRPATNLQDESAFYSFDPAEMPGTGPVPREELKIGVAYFALTDSRSIIYEESEIVSEENITVDGFSAVRRVIEGPGGGSVSTEVDTPEGKYLIAAYPPESELLDSYDSFLEYIDLNAQAPVTVTEPKRTAEVSSPVTVSGQAPGTWFFEAVLPISLVTAEGDVLIDDIFVTEEEWMTEDLLDFNLQLSFETPESNYGFIVVEKNDPSDLSHNKAAFYWPVEF